MTKAVDTPDVPALLETLDAVTKAAMAGLWDQAEWVFDTDEDRTITYEGRTFCGTGGCFAGWRALLDGAQMTQDDEGYMAIEFPNGQMVPGSQIGQWARQRLGLSVDQAGTLFEAGNSLADLRGGVIAIIEGSESWESWQDQWWESHARSEEAVEATEELELELV
jgi:hypothetical protein